ncbi:DUF6957 family protein [Zhongshania aquimaris]|uniref:DUF6957 domain-containing protein n=1 Tax=Zhongshania aquimaris TaxID=2857107 RepID=A0ABS6VR80_9GAMM|nr:hypothetical protein [Zhongshania aquimaris]MBW2940553.1 hypothetical protein [Zhongshania aquimaris]
MEDSEFQKPFGGEIKFWCRHVLTDLLPEELLKEKQAENAHYSAEIFTGQVINDALRRWRPGDAMQSSPIVNFDEETLMVETENTLYQLVGPGRISRLPPRAYWEEVGKTIILLSDGHNLTVAGEDDSILVFPDQQDEAKK